MKRVTAVAPLFTLVAAGAFGEEAWRTLHDDGLVAVELRDEGDIPWVRGRATLPVDAGALRTVLLDLARFPAWFEDFAGWEVLRRDETEALVYGRHALPWPLRDRDYVVRYRWATDADGVFSLEARSVEEPLHPPDDGVVRLTRVHSIWTVVPLADGGSRVTYTYNGELGGTVPRLLLERAWRRDLPALLRRLADASQAGISSPPSR